MEAADDGEGWRTPTPSWLEMEAADDGEDWRTPTPSWLEMEAADDGEIFFVNLIRAQEVESDEGEYDDWVDRPWSEVEEPGWCGRSCCREIVMATRKVTKAAPAEGLPAARLMEQRKKQLPQREQTMMEMLLEEQLRTELLQGEARGKAAPAAGLPAARSTEQLKKQLPQREQTMMEMLLEEQLRTQLLQGEARGKAAPAAGLPVARFTVQHKMQLPQREQPMVKQFKVELLQKEQHVLQRPPKGQQQRTKLLQGKQYSRRFRN
jgi:hypothetical protein